ncbi:Spx/MgsR family RNA polymerase-binding regulatory protein [Erythrobacter arachoides]|uniref:Spx/MgsR family RNA polymerase-binding regulatory protein n=1 Tax=Aurantiacibacter arachoides TaxID=1850444 RepID=A0A844ZW49_9SPHN|nr:arsenate reductase [Aurantiacibacter arachoides]MXO92115.1 Spx/MgsR family RNA polymerase-binding regulatory protein [Aurantiacibacter arachoides]GGD59585.1 arsenate reductase [Aurantiacibacter arachoides]
MTYLHVWGIPNCDTVKKARKWLEAQGCDYRFHDYKKEGADPDLLGTWADAVGWNVLLNRAGTTFRKLPDAEKANIDRDKAIALMAAHPSMIKRPVVTFEDSERVLVGLAQSEWENAVR